MQHEISDAQTFPSASKISRLDGYARNEPTWMCRLLQQTDIIQSLVGGALCCKGAQQLIKWGCSCNEATFYIFRLKKISFS